MNKTEVLSLSVVLFISIFRTTIKRKNKQTKLGKNPRGQAGMDESGGNSTKIRNLIFYTIIPVKMVAKENDYNSN